MLIDKKPFVYVWRPFYRFIFDGIVWPFLGRVKVFFFAESHAQLRQLTAQLAALELQLRNFEDVQRAQWTAFEQLYLCFLSDPDRNARAQADLILAAGQDRQSFEANLANGLLAFNQRSRAIFEELNASDAGRGNLQQYIIALSESYRRLSGQVADLQAENSRRLESVDRLRISLAAGEQEASGERATPTSPGAIEPVSRDLGS